ncbi:MAG: hypothetical protein L0Y71_23400 [Gemmataceae bacterium]|nr:hypothetical protein [Gemmataceae bacterium]
MNRAWLALLLLGCTPFIVPSQAQNPAGKTKLLLAFSSYRDRPKQPGIYLYEHDGVASGKIVAAIDTVNLRSDYHPSISLDGRYCVFASELENQTSRIFVWDFADKKLITLPTLNDSPNAQLHPTLTGDGRWIIYASFNKAGASQRWDLQLYDVKSQKFDDLPALNSPKFDERMPAVSADGRWIAYVSNASGGVGVSDVYLYDRHEGAVVRVPELNSPSMDITPSLNADGNLVAFASARLGGMGGRDIYLFDRRLKKFASLPGLNSAAHEQTPSLSADGRYLTFVSERIAGAGERDVFLYDRQMGKLLPTPGLNSKREDMDPVVAALK